MDGRLAGSYHLKPNFVGRAAHIANAGYFVVRDLRGHGIGERLVRHSMEQALALGFDALQFNAVFASNPARRLYERLGFRQLKDRGVYLLLGWSADGQVNTAS